MPATTCDPSSQQRLQSVLKCPHCGFAALEYMPVNACQYYYDCSNCKALLRPKPGDCCVFCSFGSVKCPSAQAADPRPGKCVEKE